MVTGMLGSHLSIAGGMYKALLEAEKLACQTVQVFTKNQQQWAAKPLAPEEIQSFKSHALRLGFNHLVAHDSYLINLASADPLLIAKSRAAFAHEMQRCDQLGIAYLVTHPGAHGGQGEAVGLQRITAMLNEIVAEESSGQVTVCLETTAGQGTSLGWRLEHLAEILAGQKHPERFGICVDTCHILAAGYDIRTAEGMQAFLAEFQSRIGLEHLRVFHLNDSLKPLASRVDRHAHLGQGHVGLAPFEVICRDARFAQVPKILETPKGPAPDGRPWDEVNLEILRHF